VGALAGNRQGHPALRVEKYETNSPRCFAPPRARVDSKMRDWGHGARRKGGSVSKTEISRVAKPVPDGLCEVPQLPACRPLVHGLPPVPGARAVLLSVPGRRATRGPFWLLPSLQARRLRHPETIPQVGRNRTKGRKSLQEPGPRALYQSVMIGARVARASPVTMAGRTEWLPAAWNGVAECPGWPGTRRSRRWLLSRNYSPHRSCRGMGAAYLVIHLERGR
jgi:hypothetical protein